MAKSYIDNPTSASPVVSANLVTGDDFTETWKCTVTDSAGQSVQVNVPVHFIRIDGSTPVVNILPSSSVVVTSPILGAAGIQMSLQIANIPGPVTINWRNTLDFSGESLIFSDNGKTNTSPDPFIYCNLNEPNKIVNESWDVTVTDVNGVVYTRELHIMFRHEPLAEAKAIAKRIYAVTNDGVVTRWMMNTKMLATDIVDWQNRYFVPNYTGGGAPGGDYGASVTSSTGISVGVNGYEGPYSLVSDFGFEYSFNVTNPADTSVTMLFRTAPENEIFGTLTVPLVFAPDAWVNEQS